MQNYPLNSSLNEEEEISELSSYYSDELKSEIIDEFLQKIRNETDYSIIDSDLVEYKNRLNDYIFILSIILFSSFLHPVRVIGPPTILLKSIKTSSQ